MLWILKSKKLSLPRPLLENIVMAGSENLNSFMVQHSDKDQNNQKYESISINDTVWHQLW